jgi:Trypsin-like peptidase domain
MVRTAFQRRHGRRVARIVLAIVIAAQAQPAPATAAITVDRDVGEPGGRPHVLTGDIARVLVRIHGGSACSGTPITGTTYVVTAAHCVLDPGGAPGARSVRRDGISYAAESVLMDDAYIASPSPRLDAAVLVMAEPIPGPSATVGERFPRRGTVTLAGLQPLDTDGALLRGTTSDNRPRPSGATGSIVILESAAAGCVHPVTVLDVTEATVRVPCGLIPGASGGGLFVAERGELAIVGIISTVARDLTSNGVVPLTALRELLAHPDQYWHRTAARPTGSGPRVVRS